jgi:hypothetical protein
MPMFRRSLYVGMITLYFVIEPSAPRRRTPRPRATASDQDFRIRG